MNLKPFWSWLGWKKGNEVCNVFRDVPDEITGYLPARGAGPINYVQFNNDCDYPTYVFYNNFDELDDVTSGLDNLAWVDARSIRRDGFACTADATLSAQLEATTGERKNMLIECLQAPLEVEDAFVLGLNDSDSSSVKRLWPNITEISLSFSQPLVREIYNDYYDITECCKKCNKALLHSFCEFYDSISVAVKHEGLYERYCGGCPVEDQTCGHKRLISFCTFYENVEIPFLAKQQRLMCKSDCGLHDIRGTPGYYNFTMTSGDADEPLQERVKLPNFRFPFLENDWDYADSIIYFGVNGLVDEDSIAEPITPKIPNTAVDSFLAPLWADFIGYGEIGAVIWNGEGMVTQWTDLEMPGGGKVTVQIKIDASGNWKVRTGWCSGDTSFLKNAVVGWQADDGAVYDKIDICDPCNIDLDFDFHRQTRYVEENIPDCLRLYPGAVLTEWENDRAYFAISSNVCPSEFTVDLLYSTPQFDQPIAASCVVVVSDI